MAGLTQNAQVRFIEQTFGGDLRRFNVVHDQSVPWLPALGAAVPRFADETSAQSMPCSARQIRARTFVPALPQWVGVSADRCKMVGVAGRRAKALRVRFRRVGLVACRAWAIRSDATVRARQGFRSSSAHRAACLALDVVRPPKKVLPARDARHSQLALLGANLPCARPRAAELAIILRCEGRQADWAGFGHTELYHILIDRRSIQDSEMARRTESR